jgi:hypothetical protein
MFLYGFASRLAEQIEQHRREPCEHKMQVVIKDTEIDPTGRSLPLLAHQVRFSR